MLVLSRKAGETIAISGDIEVKVVSISGNRVRLGISAPAECRVRRMEVATAPMAAAADLPVACPPASRAANRVPAPLARFRVAAHAAPRS